MTIKLMKFLSMAGVAISVALLLHNIINHFDITLKEPIITRQKLSPTPVWECENESHWNESICRHDV